MQRRPGRAVTALAASGATVASVLGTAALAAPAQAAPLDAPAHGAPGQPSKAQVRDYLAAHPHTHDLLRGVGDDVDPGFGVGKMGFGVVAQPGTVPPGASFDFSGLTFDLTDTVSGGQTTCSTDCDGLLLPVGDPMVLTLDPATPPPDGFLAPAPLTFTAPDCDPGGDNPVFCPPYPVTMPGTWRPVGLTVTNAATGAAVEGATYRLCAPDAQSQGTGDCPAGTDDDGTATSGADGVLAFAGLFRGATGFVAVPTDVPAGYDLGQSQSFDVDPVTDIADAGTAWNTAVSLAPLPPTLADDASTGPENGPQQLDLLGNDTAVTDPLTLTSVGDPQHGTVDMGKDGTATYTPATGYVGTDSFTYTATNALGGTATATVDLTVTDVAPTLAPLSLRTDAGSPISFDPFETATVPAGNTLTVSDVGTPQHGTAERTGDTITYTPADGFAGDDSFSYSVSDGKGGTATADVTVHVAPPPAIVDEPVTAPPAAGAHRLAAHDAVPEQLAMTGGEVSAEVRTGAGLLALGLALLVGASWRRRPAADGTAAG